MGTFLLILSSYIKCTKNPDHPFSKSSNSQEAVRGAPSLYFCKYLLARILTFRTLSSSTSRSSPHSFNIPFLLLGWVGLLL